MKSNILNKSITVILISASLLISSCSSVLDEEPRSSITSALFETEQGVELTLYGVYSKLRNYYASIGYYGIMEFPTDEVGLGDAQFAAHDAGNFSASASGDAAVNLWWSGDAFSTINACNGIIEKGAEKGISARKLAEARTIRALLYFNLIQMGGGAPLDLGSGDLAFNTLPNRKSVRNTVPECYTALIADLKTAVTDMEGTKRNDRFRGVVTKTFAQYLLSKMQLTYGWWIEKNPGQASGVTAASCYQDAYNTAMAAINDTDSGFGLETDYYRVNLGANDRNKECLFYADRDYNIPYGPQNGSPEGYGGYASSGSPENAAYLCIRMNFDRSIIVGGTTPLYRATTQEAGRPWYRGAPTQEVLFNIFNTKEHDSRYFGTFQVAWPYYGYPNGAGSLNGLNGKEFVVGDTVWYMPAMTGAELEAKGFVKSRGYDGAANNGKPVMACYMHPDMKYLTLPLDYTNRRWYPSLWKLGPYNPTLANPTLANNNSSLRPYNIAKFSELYLIAAEAAVKGATGSKTARDLLNVLRKRAAYRSNKTTAEVAASEAALTGATPASPTIDYILDERMRELYGEGIRWYDLTRTKKLGRVYSYHIRDYPSPLGTADGQDFLPIVEKTRPNFKDIPDNSKLYLRPIPTSFLNALDMTDAERQAYQNPGY